MLFDSIQITEGASISNLTVASGSTLPSAAPNAGELFFHTGEQVLYVYDGSQWDSVVTAATVNVVSVAGKTGVVTLSASDIGGLATVASTGAYADLSGKPNLTTVATSGSYSDLTNKPTIVSLGGIPTTYLGTANGVATLDGSGLIPAVQLPSYVDDVLEYATQSAFPAPGTSGKIYIETTTGKTFRWTGSVYMQIIASPGTTDAITEGTTNLFFTTSRASAAAPVQSVAGRGGSVTLSASDISGLAAVATSGSYNDLSNKPTIPTVTGTNTGDQTITLTGDVTGSGTGTFSATLATVNSNTGSFGSTTSIPVISVDAKGRITAASTVSIAAGGVTSVAGRTGGIILYQNDINGLENIATPTFAGVTAATFTGALAGNALTATKLAAPKNINGVAFDGTADITIAANANTLTGTTLASNVVSSSLTSVGTLGSLNVTGTVTAGTLAGSISSSQVTTALGFTPYNATNPNGYVTAATSPVTSVAGKTGTVNLVQADISGLTTSSTPTFSAVTASTFTGAHVGNSSSATILQTGRVISATGDATGSAPSFDGSAAVAIPLTLATVNSAPSSNAFQKITVNGKGLVTATSNVSSADITSSLGYTPANKAGETFTGAVILAADPTQALGAVTKQYVDNLSAGLVAKTAVVTSTTAALATATYANGSSGVGATLTATANGALGSIGGYAPAANDRILVKDQVSATQNGIYVVTSVGAVGSPWVLTRAPEFDNTPTGEMTAGDFTYIQGGTLAGTQWVLTTPGTIVVGTNNITWSQLAGAGVVTAGTGISVTGNQVANTGVLSIIAGTNTTVSGATGNVTIGIATAPVLTGTNFTGIPNGALTNNSVTVTAGSGLSGGGTVALGGTVTLTNAGVTSITGTTNQITASAASGAITMSLPQSINSGAAPTFAGTNFTGIPNGALTNSSVTVNGVSIALGASGTVAAAAGTLTGTTLAANVVSSSLTSVGTLASLAVTGTATAGTFSGAHTGSGAGLTSIPNTALVNSSVTVGTTAIALGAAATTIAGLASVTSTAFTGALTGNASTATSIAAGTAGQIHYQSAPGVTAFATAAAFGVVTTNGSSVPAVTAGAAGVLVGSASAVPAWSTTPTLTGTNFTGIPNGALSNSSITIGSTAMALGTTNLTIAGLTSVAATTFTGALSGNATTATGVAGGAVNQLVYQTGAGTSSFVTTANYGVVTTGATGTPAVTAGAAGVLVGSASAIPAWSSTPTLTGTNFTGIPNGALTNSSMTLNGTAVSLGGTATITAAAGTLTGTALNATVTGSSLTSVGTLTALNVAATITSTGITVDGIGNVDTATLTTSTTTANQTVDTFATATYRAVKYLISVTSGTSYHYTEVIVMHDGTTAYANEVNTMFTGVSLASFDAAIATGNLTLTVTPVNAVTTIKAMRLAIAV